MCVCGFLTVKVPAKAKRKFNNQEIGGEWGERGKRVKKWGRGMIEVEKMGGKILGMEGDRNLKLSLPQSWKFSHPPPFVSLVQSHGRIIPPF